MSVRFRQGHRVCDLALELLCVFLIGGADLATAGQVTSASIVGQVKDESGAVLPGVTVTASSPALQVSQVTNVTDEDGEYRLTPLPIGTYAVLYELSGFQPIRHEGVRLTVGFVAKLDVVLKVGTLTETITVSGAAPVVDVRTTGSSTQLTRETLELIPTGRNGMLAVLSQAPGVVGNLDVGGTVNQIANNIPIFRAFGQTAESWQTLEGVLTAGLSNNGQGNYFDYSAMEEARVQTVGTDAEMPTRGIQLVAVVKSGSNDYHGTGWWSQTSSRFQSSNLNDDLRAQGIRGTPRILTLYNLSGDLGGSLVRDKLWFYSGVNQHFDKFRVLDSFLPDGSPAAASYRQTFLTGKVSYQMSRAHRFVFFNHSALVNRQDDGTNLLTPWESRNDKYHPIHTIKGEWQAVLSNSLVTSLQYGSWISRSRFEGDGGRKLATVDVFTQRVTGTNWGMDGERANGTNNHAKGGVTWYRPNLLRGSHEFKGGFDYVDAEFNRYRESRGEAGDYRLVFNNGAPFQIQTTNYPVRPRNASHYLGIYVRDNWVIAQRLALDLGLRYAHDNGFVPEQCREAGAFSSAQCFPEVQLPIWNTVAPRVHAAYDVGGDGKTVIKGGWGRFDHRRVYDEIGSANQNLAQWTNWRWRDLNGNRAYDPGEVNLDPTGSDFLSVESGAIGSGTSFAVPNPNERQPKQDEFSLSVEREVMANMAVRATGIYSRAFNNYRIQNNLRPYDVYNIAVTRPDPGPDGRVGTGDDPGTSFTYYEFPTSLVGRQFEQGMLINDDPKNDRSYTSIELAATRRLTSGWHFMASYSATKLNEPVTGTNPAFNPNVEINAANRTWEWIGRASGSYIFPGEVLVSANFEHRAGAVWQRTVLFTGGRTIPSIQLNVEPFGSRRLPNLNLLDLRAEKRIQLGPGHRLALRVNLYNALNASTILGITSRSGPTFGRATSIVAARFLEFGASFDF